MRIEFSIDISRRWLALAGATVLVATTVATVGLVQAHGGSADLLHACYKDNGQLAWAAAADPCAANETAIHWPKRSIADLQVVKLQTLADSASPKSVTASCPTGTRVTGGG